LTLEKFRFRIHSKIYFLKSLQFLMNSLLCPQHESKHKSKIVSFPMKEYTTEIRVRYAETDQMGFVYYGTYATYLEVARVEMLRAAGISYKELESEGIIMPVTHFEINYSKPARYDDLLQIQTSIVSLSHVRVEFKYVISTSEERICEARTTLVFLDAKTLRPVRRPEHLSHLLAS
jgi:acyl-CoA thioester hydrolase